MLFWEPEGLALSGAQEASARLALRWGGGGGAPQPGAQTPPGGQPVSLLQQLRMLWGRELCDWDPLVPQFPRLYSRGDTGSYSRAVTGSPGQWEVCRTAPMGHTLRAL